MGQIKETAPVPPEISVVIAAWNAAGTIESAIRSALAQSEVTIEVIVVDDASPDEGAAVAAAIDDPRIRIIRLDRNCGPGGARNAGFSAASGDWIAVLDSDDTILPGRFTRMLTRAREIGADVVVDNLEVVRSNAPSRPMFPETLLDPNTPLKLADFIRSNIVFKSKFNLGYTKPMFSRSFIEKYRVRYDEGMSIGEDYLFLADCLAFGAVCAREPIAGYRYFIHPGSISRKLEAAEIEKIVAGDRRFLSRHRLEGDAARAQGERDKAFRRATSFLNLVDAIKHRDMGRAITIAGANPGATGLLWMPIAARWKRLTGHPNV